MKTYGHEQYAWELIMRFEYLRKNLKIINLIWIILDEEEDCVLKDINRDKKFAGSII